MSPPKPTYDVDWIYSNTSNVLIASHRDWFTSYIPFDTKIKNLLGQFVEEVVGIGHVDLPTESHTLDPSWRAFGHVHGPKTERAKWEAHLTDHAVEHHEIADADDGNG
ncbi:MAG: hypothetical protein L6R38_001164 [Xanthoria sp. 2 TBL-2021]|nr:MAG: hypothetical protein L6R38_001164 [Xanthoria sp. 2 TBL-2021]